MDGEKSKIHESKMDFEKSKCHKPKTYWKQRYHRDLKNEFEKWWVQGLTKKKTALEKGSGHSEEYSISQKARVEKKPNQINPKETSQYMSVSYRHRDPLGLETGQFPTEYMKLVRKLIREDDPTPQMETKADQQVTVNTTPQNVIALHERLVHGTNQLFDVPKSISAKIGARRLTML